MDWPCPTPFVGSQLRRLSPHLFGQTAAFRRHGKGRYEKSLGVGMKEDGTMGDVKTEIRTSAHGWCQHRECLDDPHVQAVQRRVADLTQTPLGNAEYAQLVYYHACPSADDPSCAFYKRHNDYIDGDTDKLQGVRIFTLFGYMNDVEEVLSLLGGDPSGGIIAT